MSLKRFCSAGILCLLAAILFAVPVSAHGHGGHRGGGHRQTAVTVCTVEGCAAVGRHSHDGVLYCGYRHESGFCDGQCLRLCTVEGCETAGRHFHDGTAYCGSNHEGGFCGGGFCRSA